MPPGTPHVWRAFTNNSRENEEVGPKQEGRSAVDVPGGESKVRCYKEQYYIGTWNVRFMGQGKLDVLKQETAKLNIDILGNQWSKMDENGRISFR